MNQLDFKNMSGWPASTETWQMLQNMALQAQQLALIAGGSYIISGCAVANNNAAQGVMVLNGEVLPFVGGLVQQYVVVVDEAIQRAYKGGAVGDYYHNRYAAFGTGDGQVEFSTLQAINNGLLPRVVALENGSPNTRLDRLEALTAPFAVSGGSMVFWRKAANLIPPKWQEVVDWRGRLALGYDPNDDDFSTIGNPGGSKTKNIQAANLPAAGIGYKDTMFTTYNNNVGVAGNYPSYPQEQAPVGNDNTSVGMSALDKDPAFASHIRVLQNRTTSNLGNGVAMDVMNPYRIVMFIEYIGG